MFNNKNLNLYIFKKKKSTNDSNYKDLNLYKNKVGKLYYNPSYSKE
jgi:hypothetical protein